MGWLFRRWGQPAVIGEMVGGLLLGPSFLGSFFPGFQQLLIPPSSFGSLGNLASLGVVLYMFLVGLEFDSSQLKGKQKPAWVISPTSVLVPFVLGVLLAAVLYDIYSSPETPFLNFALFIGVSMSVTAFPVLARILKERNMSQSPLGLLALACAALDDVVAWCLLALVAGLTKTGSVTILPVVLGTLGFILAMLFIVKPLLNKYLPREGEWLFLPLLIFALACSVITDLIGVHALFGAFIAGVVVSAKHPAVGQIENRMQDFVRYVLLPLFFAYSGLRTEILSLNSSMDWAFCGFVIVVAIGGKFGGTLVASRLTGLSWKDASILGVLMNTRGLVELVVLNVGLDLGILTPRLFSILVIMALVTTFMTSPILSLIHRLQGPKTYDI
jgi:Kef-type K+ transport system membrane component KefB